MRSCLARRFFLGLEGGRCLHGWVWRQTHPITSLFSSHRTQLALLIFWCNTQRLRVSGPSGGAEWAGDADAVDIAKTRLHNSLEVSDVTWIAEVDDDELA